MPTTLRRRRNFSTLHHLFCQTRNVILGVPRPEHGTPATSALATPNACITRLTPTIGYAFERAPAPVSSTTFTLTSTESTSDMSGSYYASSSSQSEQTDATTGEVVLYDSEEDYGNVISPGHLEIYTILPPVADVLYSKNLDSYPRYPRDDDERHRLALIIAYGQGSSRFPTRSRQTFVYPSTYDKITQHVSPGKFDRNEFRRIWNKKPLYLNLSQSDFTEEVYFQGLVWFADLPDDDAVIERGTTIIFGNVDSKVVKYVATICRHINQYKSFVQFNAYTKHQHELHFNHPDWPALLISVRNSHCQVPMPMHIGHMYYPEYTMLTTRPSKWNAITMFIRSRTSTRHESSKITQVDEIELIQTE